jgi:hypothetical protein
VWNAHNAEATRRRIQKLLIHFQEAERATSPGHLSICKLTRPARIHTHAC